MKGLGAGGVAAALGLWQPPRVWAQGVTRQPTGELSGTRFDLRIGETPVNITGKPRTAYAVNGSIPAPVLRWREGDTVTLHVANTLEGDDASIHWHGVLVPANMDGVPGLSFSGIRPGESYTYRFTVHQHGTFWYHSHSGFDEQRGLYGPIIIQPRDPSPVHADREHVVMLSDWTDENPRAIFAKLKKQSDYFNFNKRTVGDFFRDVRTRGLSATLAERRMWGQMRMNPTDLSDVTAYTYTYLLNGIAPNGNWTGLFKPGERVRLRFINGSAQTYFDVRIPGLKMTVVAADGNYVQPVEVEEFRIATAETYDVIVEPSGADAFTIFAQSADRTGYAAGTLAVRPGLRADVPRMDEPQLLTMADMGMEHGAMGDQDMSSAQAQGRSAQMGGSDPHAGHNMPGMTGHDMPAANAPQQSGHDMPMPEMEMQAHPESERGNPLVDMQAMMPMPRLNDPGVGLRDNGRRVLTYSDLRSAFEDPDGREPNRTIEMHLTGNMEKFAWSIDGIKFADAQPVLLKYGERLRIVLVNDTMMSHPMHLHGMWSDLEDEKGQFMVRKHTIDMQPGTKRSFRVRADALGRWAFHCHLLYHMEAGMFREVKVEE